MPYRLKPIPDDVETVGKYKDAQGNTECVTFARKDTGAMHTSTWNRGVQVKGAIPGSILEGTVIATFDSTGRYPTDGLGKHAASYLSHNAHGIEVYDQWNKQGRVKKRRIRFDNSHAVKRSDNADTFYVVE